MDLIMPALAALALVNWLLLALALPNLTLTPGAVRPLTQTQVCTVRWGLDVRHVTVRMKRRVFAAYGISWAKRGGYVVDHLIARSDGGADAIPNLWPQPKGEAKRKDVVENRLHRAVCAGTMTLSEAQAEARRYGR